jgi:hypothetical protein
MKGSHKMVTKRVLIAIKGEKQRREKKQEVGEGKNIVMIERFSVATRAWRSKAFQLSSD